ncbi:Rha family transcriptional regulator [Shewanella algae]|uniref:Rha family transcriptional regulator n=1 Tax=Shewanella algae TaxID=38313 RepID=UPI001AAF221A|nr:Rha family transcriptional regulator [Shewanella algae]MBO2587199.1 Rha family transcriptional regulator [Shewanella algae]
MSSREIAELTGKTHANVCRDIRNMLAQLGADQISFESGYFDAPTFGVVYLDAKGEASSFGHILFRQSEPPTD